MRNGSVDRNTFQFHSCFLTSTVFGTISARSSISTRPLGEPPMEISKKTTGLLLMVAYGLLVTGTVYGGGSGCERNGLMKFTLNSKSTYSNV